MSTNIPDPLALDSTPEVQSDAGAHLSQPRRTSAEVQYLDPELQPLNPGWKLPL